MLINKKDPKRTANGACINTLSNQQYRLEQLWISYKPEIKLFL